MMPTSATGLVQICLLISTFLTVIILEPVKCWTHESEVDEVVRAAMKCGNIPGMSLAVVKDGRVLMMKGYGFADVDKKEPATKNTKFLIASLTKAFTSTLLAELLHKNRFNWTTPIKEILGEGFYIGNRYISDNINLIDLLSHRTGFPASNMLWMAEKFTTKQIIQQLRFMKTSKPFRSNFSYNNIIYILAGHIASVIGGDTYQRLLHNHVIDRLNMTDTVNVDESGPNKNFSRSYKFVDGTRQTRPWRSHRNQAGSSSAASLCSTAEDMAKWLIFHLEKMRQQKDDKKQEKTDNKLYKDMYTSQNIVHEAWNIFRTESMPVSAVYNYGLGWFTGAQNGYLSAYHYGWLLDFYSRVLLFPRENFAIFTSLNGNKNGIRFHHMFRIQSFISNLILGDKQWINSTNVCSEIKSKRTNPTSVSTDKNMIQPVFYSIPNYDELEGNYGNALYANLTIRFEWRVRQLRLKYGSYVDLILTETSEKDKYSIDAVEPLLMLLCVYDDFLTFSRDKSGKIDSLLIPCFDEGAEMRFYKNFILTDETNPGDSNSQIYPGVCQVSSFSNRLKFDIFILVLIVCFNMYICINFRDVLNVT